MVEDGYWYETWEYPEAAYKADGTMDLMQANGPIYRDGTCKKSKPYLEAEVAKEESSGPYSFCEVGACCIYMQPESIGYSKCTESTVNGQACKTFDNCEEKEMTLYFKIIGPVAAPAPASDSAATGLRATATTALVGAVAALAAAFF